MSNERQGFKTTEIHESHQERRRQRIQRLSTQVERLSKELNKLIIEDKEEVEAQAKGKGIQFNKVTSISKEVAEVSTHQEEVEAPEVGATKPVKFHPRKQLQQQEKDTDLKQGDRIQVTNHYQGKKGSKGKVVYTTPKQVGVVLDGEKRVRTKYRSSVKRI